MTSEAEQRGLSQVRDLIHQAAGLEPPSWVLEARVAERMKALGLVRIDDYLSRLTNRAERSHLVELLRVGETSFFRHGSHIRALEELVIPDLLTRPRPLRVWSAGCATGEEPYTLAMLFTEAFHGVGFEILASDVSPSSLERGRQGVYSSTAFQRIPSRFVHLVERDGAALRMRSTLIDRITFEERNLAAGAFPTGFDLILCRNVLIYFSTDSKAQALRRLVRALKPDGYLFLGYSESLRDVPGLEAVKRGDTVLYRKKSDSQPHRPRRRSEQPSTPARPEAIHLNLRGSYEGGHRLLAELREAETLALASAGRHELHVEFSEAEYLDDDCAQALKESLARCQTRGIRVVFRALSPGAQRFLRRHHLEGK